MIKAANLDNIRAAVKRLGIVIIVFIAVCAFFGVLLPTFFTMANIQNILLTVSITGTLALGMTFAVISGGYDLSMGCGLTLSGVISGYLMTILGAPDVAAILASLVFGLVLGFANGFMITKMKLPPFIATLGSMMLCKGLSLIISEGKVYAVGASEHPVYTGLVKGSVIGNIPNAIVLFVIFAVISHLILTRTVFGKYVFAIGSKEEAVKLSGIDADKYRIYVYIAAGLCTGIGGILMAARLTSVQPGLGSGYEMDAIAATVLGGTPLSGGEGSILGTVLGVLTLTILLNGMRLMGIDTNWQTVMTGAVVVAAVFIDALKNKR